MYWSYCFLLRLGAAARKGGIRFQPVKCNNNEPAKVDGYLVEGDSVTLQHIGTDHKLQS